MKNQVFVDSRLLLLTDTHGETRRAWNTKDLIYMAEGKTETAAKQTAKNSSSVEVCASFSGFLSTWNTLKGLRHLERGGDRVSKVSQTPDLLFYRPCDSHSKFSLCLTFLSSDISKPRSTEGL